jgi:hypothetical protein
MMTVRLFTCAIKYKATLRPVTGSGLEPKQAKRAPIGGVLFFSGNPRDRGFPPPHTNLERPPGHVQLAQDSKLGSLVP